MALLTTIEFPLVSRSKDVLRLVENEARKMSGVLGSSIRYVGVGYTNRTPILMLNVVQSTMVQERKFMIETSRWLVDLENRLMLNYE